MYTSLWTGGHSNPRRLYVFVGNIRKHHGELETLGNTMCILVQEPSEKDGSFKLSYLEVHPYRDLSKKGSKFNTQFVQFHQKERNGSGEEPSEKDGSFKLSYLEVHPYRDLSKKGSKFNTQFVQFHQKERNGSGEDLVYS
ncbi:hypothetical protein CFP56_018387, partial [Quercus suber]